MFKSTHSRNVMVWNSGSSAYSGRPAYTVRALGSAMD